MNGRRVKRKHECFFEGEIWSMEEVQESRRKALMVQITLIQTTHSHNRCAMCIPMQLNIICSVSSNLRLFMNDFMPEPDSHLLFNEYSCSLAINYHHVQFGQAQFDDLETIFIYRNRRPKIPNKRQNTIKLNIIWFTDRMWLEFYRNMNHLLIGNDMAFCNLSRMWNAFMIDNSTLGKLEYTNSMNVTDA